MVTGKYPKMKKRLICLIFCLLVAPSFSLEELTLNAESTKIQLEVKRHKLLKLSLKSRDISSILAREKNLYLKFRLGSVQANPPLYEAILSTHSNLKYLEEQSDQSLTTLRVFLQNGTTNVLYLSKEN